MSAIARAGESHKPKRAMHQQMDCHIRQAAIQAPSLPASLGGSFSAKRTPSDLASCNCLTGIFLANASLFIHSSSCLSFLYFFFYFLLSSQSHPVPAFRCFISGVYIQDTFSPHNNTPTHQHNKQPHPSLSTTFATNTVTCQV